MRVPTLLMPIVYSMMTLKEGTLASIEINIQIILICTEILLLLKGLQKRELIIKINWGLISH